MIRVEIQTRSGKKRSEYHFAMEKSRLNEENTYGLIEMPAKPIASLAL